MVRFSDKSYTVEVYTGTNPVEDYLELQKEIAYVFGMMREGNIPADGLYHLANLLSCLQPDLETAWKMVR